MPRERPHAADLTKRRGHRQQLILGEMWGQPINVHVRGFPLSIHADVGARRVWIQLIFPGPGDCVLKGWTMRVWVEEEGSAGLGVGLSITVDVGEGDG